MLDRRILRFALTCIPLFLVFFVLYLWIVPTYSRTVLGVANAVTTRLSPATEIRPFPDGVWEATLFSPAAGRSVLRGWTPSTAHLIFLSLVSLPALLLATPAPFTARLRMLALSLPLTFAAHVLAVITLTRGTVCLAEAPGTFFCLWALRMAYTSGQLVAGALWVLLAWRFWFSPAGRRDVARVAAAADTDPSL